jgi:6-phosphogluconolactonase
VKPNQESPRAHFAAFNTAGTYLYVVDLGIDKILVYPVSNDGLIGEGQTALEMDPGDGPRHLVFHPEKDLVFVVNELSNSVISAQVDPITGRMKRLDKKSTLPQGYSDKSYCADIHISKDGRFLYASNRGHNSIAIFKVLENGQVELMGTEPVQGDWPRNFAISPSGKHLLVANQNSNSITVFDVNPETGLLHFTGQKLEMEHPVCLQF